MMERALRFAIHLIAWVASLGIAVAACAGVYFLSINNLEVRPEFAFSHEIFHTEHEHWSVHYKEHREAELLLLPEHTQILLDLKNYFARPAPLGSMARVWDLRGLSTSPSCLQQLLAWAYGQIRDSASGDLGRKHKQPPQDLPLLPQELHLSWGSHPWSYVT